MSTVMSDGPAAFPFLIFLTATAVQHCQAVSVLELDGGNWTGGNMKKEEIFEKFYGCYFGKYFHNSDPPISLEQFVQQRVEASLGSDEKVKKREIQPCQ